MEMPRYPDSGRAVSSDLCLLFSHFIQKLLFLQKGPLYTEAPPPAKVSVLPPALGMTLRVLCYEVLYSKHNTAVARWLLVNKATLYSLALDFF